jgi:hypothetical protein
MPTRPFYFHEQKLHFLVATQLELVLQEPLVKAVNLGAQGSLVGFLKEVGTSLVEVTRLGGVSWQVVEWVYLMGVQHC